MPALPLFQKIDAGTVAVPDLDSGLRFYRDCLGHELRWRNDDVWQATLGLPASDSPFDIPVGRAAVVADPFGNVLAILDLSKRTYVTDSTAE